MKERLIELIRKSEILCDDCGDYGNTYCTEAIADYLLKNGVIAPPCKVGDFIEWKKGIGGTTLYRVNGFYYDPNDRGLRYIIDLCTPVIDNSAIVRIITKEEHEKALAEGSGK